MNGLGLLDGRPFFSKIYVKSPYCIVELKVL